MSKFNIIAYDNEGARLTTTAPEDNIWIDVKRADGAEVYVGSLYFEEQPDGSLKVSWGSSRNEYESWDECESVTIPAPELKPKVSA